MAALEELECRLTKIRQKLKSWEAAFAADNAGRKPSREDVKRNPDIGMQVSGVTAGIRLTQFQLSGTKTTTKSAISYRGIKIILLYHHL